MRAPTTAEAWRAYKPASFGLLQAVDGDHVLDVGCGTGEDAREIALAYPGVAVTGIDRDPGRIAEAERLTLGIPRPVQFHAADAVRLPFEDGAFDAARADRVFHHLEAPATVLREMARVVRSGGRLVVTDPEWESLVVAGASAAVTRRIVTWWCDHHLPQGRIARDLPGLFREAGLTGVLVAPVVLSTTTYDEEVLHLAERAGQAREAGAIPGDAADAWIAALPAAARGGRFLCLLTMVTVTGRTT